MSTTPVTMNRQLRLASRPVGLPVAANWRIAEEPVPAVPAGGVLVKTLSLSLDPAMRGWMNEGRSYIAPVGLGDVMRAGGIGRVIASEHPGFRVGDTVSGRLNVQTHAAFRPEDVAPSELHTVDLALGTPAQWLNVLGMPGMTAYFGLFDVGQPKAGETVVVSAAAGAVGQTVGQLAKIRGCRVIGIAGGAEKCDWVVRELGFDACIDYKGGAVREGLKQHCPDGLDIYFDNVGGEILEAALGRLRRHARIVLCGAISQYNATQVATGPRNYMNLLVHRGRMEGMVVFDYADRFPQAIAEMARYLREGRMHSKEDVVEGRIDDFPALLLRLFEGGNFGKLVLQLARD